MKKARFFLLLSVPALFIFSACSCTTEDSLRQILRINKEVPVFLNCRPVSSTEIVFTFSVPVRVVSVNFDPAVEAGQVQDGAEVKITLTRPLEAGTKITADLLVEDSDRNTLNVIVPFRSRNDRIPAMVFNEIRTEYSKPKVEFIEFYTLEPGNLGAVRLFISCKSLTLPVYEFLPTEVAAREYIVLHLRSIEDGCVDETGPDLSLSGGTDALKDARDFWLPGATKILHRTDALWLLDQDDNIIDAVLLCEGPGNWGKNNTATAAEFLARQDAWENDPSGAVNSTGTTYSKTICRDETIPPERRAANWYITASGNATPGKVNSTKR